MRAISAVLFMLFLLLQSGCASNLTLYGNEKAAIDNVTTPFAEGKISIEILSVPNLNALNGMANSCTLLVLQANKAATLSQFLMDPVSVRKMFNEATADKGILKVDRYSAMPGQRTTLHIDRNQTTRYVAIVAGYYPFPHQQQMMLVGIPVKTKSYGFWRTYWQATLQPLTMQIQLGSNSITQYGIRQPILPLVADNAPTAEAKAEAEAPVFSLQGE